MPVVLRLWAPPGAETATAERRDILGDVIAGLMKGQEPVLLEYVQSCDVDARDGNGDVKLTRDPSKAMRFANQDAALTYWKRQSTVRPFRPDGKPNRPLTAYNVIPEKVE